MDKPSLIPNSPTPDDVCWFADASQLATSPQAAHPPFEADRLFTIRREAWCEWLASGKKPRQEQVAERAKNWMRFLKNDSARTTFLRRELIQTTGPFYSAGCLTPRAQKEWGNPPPGHPLGWKDVLPWLSAARWPRASICATKLTTAELELTLVLFDWFHTEPRFAPWVYEDPHVVPAAEEFLLRRYCWPLLKALRIARCHGRRCWWVRRLFHKTPLPCSRCPACFPVTKVCDKDRVATPLKCDFNQTAYRAGEYLGIHLRIWGLAGIGQVALFGTGLASTICSSVTPPSWDSVEWTSRASRLIADPTRRWNCGEGLCGWMRFLFGVGLQGVVAIFFGTALQWFWEDKSAIDPV